MRFEFTQQKLLTLVQDLKLKDLNNLINNVKVKPGLDTWRFDLHTMHDKGLPIYVTVKKKGKETFITGEGTGLWKVDTKNKKSFPGSFLGGPSENLYDKKEAKKALKDAKKVLENNHNWKLIKLICEGFY